MKPIRDLVGARPLAVHCSQLLSRAGVSQGSAPDVPTDLQGEGAEEAADADQQAAEIEAKSAAELADFIAEYSAQLPRNLQSVLGGRAPVLSASEPAVRPAAALMQALREGHVHYRIDWPGMPRCLVSFDCATALSITDRIFGGDGKTADTEAQSVPRSTMLAAERIVRKIASSLEPLLSGDPDGETSLKPAIEGHMKLARLAPFTRSSPCLSWSMTVTQEDADPWTFTLSMLEGDLRGVLAGGGTTKGSSSDGNNTPETDAAGPTPGHKPGQKTGHMNGGICADVPMELVAILARLRMPLSKLSVLSPGQTIPIAAPRNVNLYIGEKTLGSASIGTLDNKIALRIHQLGEPAI